MYQVNWLDQQGNEQFVRSASWKFASEMAKQLQMEGNQRVRLTAVRRDVYEVNLKTMQTWEIARNRLLSRVTAEIKEFLSDNPDVSLLIVPPKPRRSRNAG